MNNQTAGNSLRDQYVNASGLANATIPIDPRGQIMVATDKVRDIMKLLSGTNEVMASTRARLSGAATFSDDAEDSPAPMGQIGELQSLLSELYDLASRTSDLAGEFSRL